METAVAYARQSFGLEDGSVSIEVQIEACRKWAKEHGVTITGEFADANTSSELYPDCTSGRDAAKIDRGFQTWQASQRTKGRKQYKAALGQAFDKIEQEHPTYLIVYTRNRLGRTADNSYLDRYFDSFLIEQKCSLVIVQTGTVIDFSDKFISLVMQLKDSLDYASLKEKRLASIESINKRINDFRKWSNAYGVVMDKGTLTFDEKICEAIKMIFEDIASGVSYSQVLKKLNGNYAHLARGKQWYMTNIYAALKNPVYCGYMHDRNGVLGRAKNIPSPIISYALYKQANDAAAAKKTNAGKYNEAGESKHFLPLSGYLKCECGRRLTVFVDKGKIGYHCINGGKHKTSIYINDAVLLTIQQIFVVNAIESRKKLETLKTISGVADALKAKLDKLTKSLKAKFAAIDGDEDLEFFRAEINATKAEIAATKKELIEAEAMNDAEQAKLAEQLERDFTLIMDRKLMPQNDFMRLLAETVDDIIVTDDALKVNLTNGMVITIPRLPAPHHGRRLMTSTLVVDSTDETLGGVMHYQLHYYDGSPVITGGEVQFENDCLSVYIH